MSVSEGSPGTVLWQGPGRNRSVLMGMLREYDCVAIIMTLMTFYVLFYFDLLHLMTLWMFYCWMLSFFLMAQLYRSQKLRLSPSTHDSLIVEFWILSI